MISVKLVTFSHFSEHLMREIQLVLEHFTILWRWQQLFNSTSCFLPLSKQERAKKKKKLQNFRKSLNEPSFIYVLGSD